MLETKFHDVEFPTCSVISAQEVSNCGAFWIWGLEMLSLYHYPSHHHHTCLSPSLSRKQLFTYFIPYFGFSLQGKKCFQSSVFIIYWALLKQCIWRISNFPRLRMACFLT